MEIPSAPSTGGDSGETSVFDKYTGENAPDIDLTEYLSSLTKMLASNDNAGFSLDLGFDVGSLMEGADLSALMDNFNMDKFNDMFGDMAGKFGDLTGFADQLGLGTLTGKLDGLMSAFSGSGLAMTGALSDIMANKMNGLAEVANDVLLKASGKLLIDLLVKRISGWIAGRIYLPEVVFLTTIKGLYALGGDPQYKNLYLRNNIVLEKDLYRTHKWLNGLIHEKYNLHSNLLGFDADTSSKHGSWHIVGTILDAVYKNINDLKKVTNRYEQFILRLDKEIAAEVNVTLKIRKQTELDIYTTKHNPVNDTAIKSVDSLQDILLKTMKQLISHSYGDFSVNQCSKMLKKYKINRSVFGETDTEYNKKYMFNQKDLSTMAQIDPDKGCLILRNRHMKKIYIMLASSRLAGNPMKHLKMYELLKKPVCLFQNDILDAITPDFGPLFDSLKDINADKIYKYAKGVENNLHDQSKIEYFITKDQSLKNPYITGDSPPPTKDTQTSLERFKVFSDNVIITGDGKLIIIETKYYDENGNEIKLADTHLDANGNLVDKYGNLVTTSDESYGDNVNPVINGNGDIEIIETLIYNMEGELLTDDQTHVDNDGVLRDGQDRQAVIVTNVLATIDNNAYEDTNGNILDALGNPVVVVHDDSIENNVSYDNDTGRSAPSITANELIINSNKSIDIDIDDPKNETMVIFMVNYESDYLTNLTGIPPEELNALIQRGAPVPLFRKII